MEDHGRDIGFGETHNAPKAAVPKDPSVSGGGSGRGSYDPLAGQIQQETAVGSGGIFGAPIPKAAQGTKQPWPTKGDLRIGILDAIPHIALRDVRESFRTRQQELSARQFALRKELSSIDNKLSVMTYLVDLLS